MPYLALLFCLLAGINLHAQSGDKPQNTWEISASFAPDLHKRPFLNGVRLEADPNDFLISQRPFNSFDTINIAGQARIFSSLPSFGFKAEPSSSNLWFGASVTAHRRIGIGLDISAGLFYNQASYTIGAEDRVTQRGIVNTFVPLLHNLEETTLRVYGITLRGNYHLFAKARLHPYFGFGVNLYNLNSTRINLGRAYSGDTSTVLFLNTNPPVSERSYVSLDFVATAGLLYRISDAWSVGLDITNRLFTGPGLIGAQVRRRL